MQQITRIAIAVMVKTPGVSPVKTRLAKQVGVGNAEKTFELCLQVLEHELRSLDSLDISTYSWHRFWAVCEREAISDKRWNSFATVWQGSGATLGDKLATVYHALKLRHDIVCLLGGDTPQLSLELWTEFLKAISIYDFVIGPSSDGGFYLVAGKQPLAKSLWRAVRYSEKTTGDQLHAQLVKLGSVGMLAPLQDIDHVEDLSQVLRESPPVASAMPWRELKTHLKNLLKQHHPTRLSPPKP